MLFSFENLHRQYLRCRRNKRNTANALRFEVRQEHELLALREALEARTYASRSVCFFTTRPKLREVFAADFRDRIVHHLLVDELEKVWEPIFIHDSYACRRGKGVHRGVARLRQFIRQVTANGTQRAWYLQLDIRNYFLSIDKDLLYALIARKTRDEDVLWLARVLIFHDCTENARRACYGFPVDLLGPYVRRLFRYRAPVTVVLEKHWYWTGIKERVPAYRFEPLRTR